MEDAHLIYIDRLIDDRIEKIQCTLHPEFIQVAEKDVFFTQLVDIQGEAYLASEHLVLHLTISTGVTLPCSHCNEPTLKKITLNNFYHTVPVSEIKGSVFDSRDVVREAILLETPQYAECGNGMCPNKAFIAQFCSNEAVSTSETSEHVQFPFADLAEHINKSSKQ